MELEQTSMDQEVIDTVMPDETEFTQFMARYRQVMALYESAIQCVTMRLDLIEKECEAQQRRAPIRSVTSRIKSPGSINRKLKSKGLPLTMRSILEELNDVAGVRIVCEYIPDIYAVRDALLSGGHIELLREKDYIKHPKPNGYRSLHLIVHVPLPLHGGVRMVKCEIQLRTTAMDSWAGLEHNLRYKKDRPYDAEIDRELRECAGLLAETDRRMEAIAKQLEIFPD